MHDAFSEGRREAGYGVAAAAEGVFVGPDYGANERNSELRIQNEDADAGVPDVPKWNVTEL